MSSEALLSVRADVAALAAVWKTVVTQTFVLVVFESEGDPRAIASRKNGISSEMDWTVMSSVCEDDDESPEAEKKTTSDSFLTSAWKRVALLRELSMI